MTNSEKKLIDSLVADTSSSLNEVDAAELAKLPGKLGCYLKCIAKLVGCIDDPKAECIGKVVDSVRDCIGKSKTTPAGA